MRVGRAQRRGAALILVVVVIAALLAIAAPFVVSMRLHEKSSMGFNAQIRAKQIADGARNQAVAHLMRSHPDEERRERAARQTQAGDEEGQDLHAEIQRFDARVFEGLEPFQVAASKGSMVQVSIKDVRSRIDLNTAGPDVLANLFGATVSTEVLTYSDDKRLFVQDISPFLANSDGDPETIDGFVRMNGEYIAYRHIDLQRGCFEGLVRGFLFSRGQEPEDDEVRRNFHAVGSLIQDGRGHKLSYDPLWRFVGTDRQGQLARFDNTAGIRRIADWEFGTLRAALVLYRYGVNMKLLRKWGVAKNDLFEAGLHPADFDVDQEPEKETAAQRRERITVEKTLKRWKVPTDFARTFGGYRAVKRIYDRLMAMDEDRREKVIENYKKRESQLQANLTRISGWLKKETKRQMGMLSEARNNSPHLETVGRIELEEKIRPLVSTDSPPEGELWSDRQTVNHRVDFRPYGSTTQLRLQDTRRFRRGWIVQLKPRRMRAEDPPRPPEYRMCVAVNRERISLFPQLDEDYLANELDVSCRQPRPVNINTASREVLAAILTGLRSRTGQRARARGGAPPNLVTPDEAYAVAQAIVAAPGGFATPLDLRNLLLQLRTDGKIEDHDVDAIYRNAIDPGDSMLTRATVPFAFRSGDVYELSVTGIVNDPAGNELARHSFREVVRVAPPRSLVWTIDSQQDFTDRVYIPGRRTRVRDERRLQYPGPLPWLALPGRWSNQIKTRPVDFGPYTAAPLTWPSRGHQGGEGDIRAAFAREPDQGTPGTTAEPNWASLGNSGPTPGALAPHNPNRWDNQLEGENLATIALDPNTTPTRWYQTQAGVGRATLGPGMVRGWFRFDQIPAQPAKSFLFDGGKGNVTDRISLYLNGPTQMVLEVFDEALDQAESGGNPRSTRLVYDRPVDLPFRNGNWYHVAAFFKGADRGDLALAVDGEFVGQETHGSRLTQALDRWSGQLTVEDATGFPPSGFVRVGSSRWIGGPNAADRGIWNTGFDANQRCEVLYYSRVSGNTLVLETLNTMAATLPQGHVIVSAVDNDATNGANRAFNSIPLVARAPLRGSGHRARVTVRMPVPPRGSRTYQRNVNVGYPHDAGTQVVPFGYSSWLKNEGPNTPAVQVPGLGALPSTGYQETLRVGGATLTQPLPRNTPHTLLYAESPYNAQNPLPQVISPADTEIPVFWLEPFATEQPINVPNDPTGVPMIKGGFPPFGILRIGTERVFYSGIDPVRGRFLNCVRGVEGSVAVTHNLFTPVILESIVTTNMSDYATRDAFSEPRVYVSLTDGRARHRGNNTEWISIMRVQDQNLRARGLVLIPVRDDFGQLARSALEGPLNDMRRLNTMPRGENPGINNALVPLPPNPPPVQPPWYAPYYGLPWKEVLKRQNAGGAMPMTFRIGRRTISVPFLEMGARRCKRSYAANPMRGWASGTRLVPTFFLRLQDGNYNGSLDFSAACEAGQGDTVTLLDDTAPGEEMRVAHSQLGFTLPPQIVTLLTQAGQTIPGGDQATGWMVSFDDYVSRPYLGTGNARLARWPVGNLRDRPTLVFGRARDPSGPNDAVIDAPGTLAGRIDDFVVEQLDERPNPGRLVSNLPYSLQAGDTAISGISVNVNSWNRGRLLRADGEVLGVVSAVRGQPGADLTLARGALTTTAAPISRETVLWRLTWPPMAVATGGFSGQGNRQIPVRRPDAAARFRADVDGGYLRVDGTGGLLPYVRLRAARNSYFDRPVDRFGRGAYDAAFGGPQARPAANSVLTDHPFRHHDRYRPRTNSLQGVFFQASRELPGSFVERITWDESTTDGHNEVKVLVRVDGAPSWDARVVPPGTSGVRGLYVFDDPREANRIDLPATRVEIRVVPTYAPQALTQDAWKHGAVVGAVRLHYRQGVRTLRREERTD